MDPVTLAVVRGGIEQIADEMDLHLIHAALSPIISETNDCANGFFHPDTGETIAQGGYGLPQFLANMQFTVQRLIAIAAGQGGFRPGDIWIVNDPYISGTHLNDIVMVSPYFVDGKLFALFANTGHWMDLGGSAPGGWVPRATEIYHEGITIPPLRLYAEGVRNDAVVAMLTANSRMPDQLLGDMAAMTNVFAVGRRGFDMLVERYGVTVLSDCVAEMLVRSEAEMRSYIADIPDGRYVFDDFFDNDGVSDVRLPIRLAVTVTGDSLEFDFTGTAPAARGPMNIADCTTRSMCFVALKHLFPDVPVNGGVFRPVRFVIPEGSILAAQRPRPVGGTTDVTQRVVAMVFGALGHAIPEIAPAAAFGTTGVVTVSGSRPDNGNYYVAVYPYPGGYGASRQSDGLVNGTPPGSMAKFMSIEMSEHRYPVRFGYYRIREGSGGAGARRGGCGTEYGIEMLADTLVSVLGDQVDSPPFGAMGGGAAAGNAIRFTLRGQDWVPPMRSKAEKVACQAGDMVHLASPGGGGFGLPAEREPGAVIADLNAGIIDAATARDTYGVKGEVDRLVLDRPVYKRPRQELV
ncbi:hydantoinase B/oxoprolinase family protein [Novosphingobium colocasiae]|uniref:Methylhydantoinase n=1 Tax=Novosphingobium colocasiae TaxID=1256513 RepID=A0A918UDH7_9SPHN|nr:hydantoinase B/oxoprolinase family protein [Novosphingobium colocasiae]GGY93266.1 methylhydantoinase [Novosphingobium colocasiae]